jgi:hypothetical protein
MGAGYEITHAETTDGNVSSGGNVVAKCRPQIDITC